MGFFVHINNGIEIHKDTRFRLHRLADKETEHRTPRHFVRAVKVDRLMEQPPLLTLIPMSDRPPPKRHPS